MIEDSAQDFTPISKVGEFKFIEEVTADFPTHNESIIKGVGDDAAVYSINDSEVHVVTTDLLIEGIHFDLRYVPMMHLGYKSVVVNLSDVFAMNAQPFGVTISVAMSSRFTMEAMTAFYEGVRLACDKYKIDLLGGDTSSSTTGLLISVTAIGKAHKDKVVYRSGAKENQLVCVTGDLGAAYSGLQLLEREKRVFLKNPDIQPDLGGYDYVVGRQLKPEARWDVIKELEQKGIKPTSMIDISDGLASELHHICNASDCGVQIYQEKIPIDHQVSMVAEEFNGHPVTYALNGGEDYELLFTIGLEDYLKIQKVSDVYVIGHILEKSAGIHLVTPEGGFIPIPARGFKHFDSAE